MISGADAAEGAPLVDLASLDRAGRPRKAATAFRTISEVADDLHVPQHVLRFWETRFPQVKPLKRGGGRRYYRPDDVVLLRRIADLLYIQGYTIKGVQRLLLEGDGTLGGELPPPEASDREEEAGAVGGAAGAQITLADPLADPLAVGESGEAMITMPTAASLASVEPEALHRLASLRVLLSEVLRELEAMRSRLRG